jgi:DNA-binding NarL/FixJ family response regulator
MDAAKLLERHRRYLPPWIRRKPGALLLTRREWEMVELAVSGVKKRRIAELRNVSLGTVGYHLTNVYRKLGVGDIRELVIWAWKRNDAN